MNIREMNKDQLEALQSKVTPDRVKRMSHLQQRGALSAAEKSELASITRDVEEYRGYIHRNGFFSAVDMKPKQEQKGSSCSKRTDLLKRLKKSSAESAEMGKRLDKLYERLDKLEKRID